MMATEPKAVLGPISATSPTAHDQPSAVPMPIGTSISSAALSPSPTGPTPRDTSKAISSRLRSAQ